jgi:hypothetical protein
MPEIGQKCFDYWSWWPDFDKCDDGTKPCENRPLIPNPNGIPQVFGECLYTECIEEYKDPDYQYPDCSEMNYNWCED